MKKIDCFIPFVNKEQVQATIDNLKENELINNIFRHTVRGSTATQYSA